MSTEYGCTKEYGPHEYHAPNMIGDDCQYGCGCYMGGHSSGGPVGINPFGECPNNPKDGELVGGTADYEIVVERRLYKLTSDMEHAEERARKAEEASGKGVVALQQELDVALLDVARLTIVITSIRTEVEEAFKKLAT